MKKTKKIIFLTVSLFFLYGCELALLGLGAGGGIAGYKYLEGHTTTELPLKYSRAWNVTNKALENLEISISNSMDEGNKGRIEAVRKDGKKITRILKDQGLGITNIIVVVGLFSDRESAEKVHDEILSISGV